MDRMEFKKNSKKETLNRYKNDSVEHNQLNKLKEIYIEPKLLCAL